MDLSRVPSWAKWTAVIGVLALIGMCRGKGRRPPANDSPVEQAASQTETRRVSFSASMSPTSVSAGDSFVVTVQITNHDKKAVENLRVSVRGPWDDMRDNFVASLNVTQKSGLLSGPNLQLNDPIEPGETATVTVKLFTKTAGVHEFRVSLSNGGKGPALRDQDGTSLAPVAGIVKVRSI